MNSMPFDIFDFPTLPAAQSQRGVKSERCNCCKFLPVSDFEWFWYLHVSIVSSIVSSIIFSNPRVLLWCSCATVLGSQPLNVGEEEPLLSALTCQDHGKWQNMAKHSLNRSSLDRQSHSHFNWTSPTNPKSLLQFQSWDYILHIQRWHYATSNMFSFSRIVLHIPLGSVSECFDMLPQCTNMIE